MRRLSFITGFFFVVCFTFGQSPHGKKLNLECESCHTNNGWKVDPANIRFDHNKTSFKLSGQHKNIDCRKCHKSLEFSTGEAECRACHTDMHNGTVGWDCARCHQTQTWIVTNIKQLHLQTRFPLLGAHAVADCYSCHKTGSLLRFEPLGTECYDCHKSDYEATNSPSHKTAGYSTDCQQCHKMSSPVWNAAGINHSFFPLTGGHAIGCNQCHTQGTFGNLSTDCYSCHSADYNSAANPSHTQFPKTCQSCHNIRSWSPATFDHNITSFPLTGAHLQVSCSNCHASGYNNTPSDCNSCHANQYNATTNPTHSAAQFPRTCETCHKTTAWTPATFNHDGPYFPIYSGRHRSAWSLCSDCHPSTSNFTVFSCITCHEHEKPSTDGHHSGVSGYSYTATSCLTCHPRGSGD